MFGDDRLVLGRFKGRLYLAPASFFALDEIELSLVSNGCGSSGALGKVVPDTAWGQDISGPCHIHDFMYMGCAGKLDEIISDCVLAFNLVLEVIQQGAGKIATFLRMMRVCKYIVAVATTVYSDEYWEENRKLVKVSRYAEASFQRGSLK